MIDFRIHDSNFVGDASSSRYYAPERLRWVRSGPDTDVTFYTDQHLEVPRDRHTKKRVAWILEPREINSRPYEYIVQDQNWRSFDLVLTHHRDMQYAGDNFVWYPNGMSWVAAEDWRQYEKSKMVSIIASDKRTAVGHKLRHQVIGALGSQLDVFGRGYRPVEHKVEALAPYCYSVVIENCQAPGYFSEKLLDCFATYTVPIYWGDPWIGDYFDTRGMLIVQRFQDIEYVVYGFGNLLRRDVYEAHLPYIRENHELAKKYRVAEDWIFDNVLKERGWV